MIATTNPVPMRTIPEIAADFRHGVDTLLWQCCTWEVHPAAARRDLATADATLRGLERLMLELRQSTKGE